MKFAMYSIYDKAVGTYAMPFSFRVTPHSQHGPAIRSFRRLYGDRDSMLSVAPQDFELFQVAEFDDETGSISASLQLIDTGAFARAKDEVSHEV